MVKVLKANKGTSKVYSIDTNLPSDDHLSINLKKETFFTLLFLTLKGKTFPRRMKFDGLAVGECEKYKIDNPLD